MFLHLRKPPGTLCLRFSYASLNIIFIKCKVSLKNLLKLRYNCQRAKFRLTENQGETFYYNQSYSDLFLMRQKKKPIQVCQIAIYNMSYI